MSKTVTRKRDPRHDHPSDIWTWYQFQRAMLNEEAVRAFAFLNGGPSTSEDAKLARYLGQTAEGLMSLFDNQNREVDFLTMLGLLAATEGVLQRDFLARVDKRLKDVVSRQLKKISERGTRRNERISLEDDILAIWRDHGPQPKAKNTVNLFISAFDLRHWLAHGR